MKKILICFSLILFASLFIHPRNLFALESTSSSAAVKYNLVFPIASLGNCNSIAECKIFCDNPTNYQACHVFAVSKDLYKVNPVSVAAKAELGCDISTSSCKEVCSKKENFIKCKLFGEKYFKLSTTTVCANFCVTNPEACKPKNLPLGKYSQLEYFCKSSGCTWSNFTCTCPKITPKNSTTSASTSAVNRVLPLVQGVLIGPNLFQKILLFLQGK